MLSTWLCLMYDVVRLLQSQYPSNLTFGGGGQIKRKKRDSSWCYFQSNTLQMLEALLLYAAHVDRCSRSFNEYTLHTVHCIHTTHRRNSNGMTIHYSEHSLKCMYGELSRLCLRQHRPLQVEGQNPGLTVPEPYNHKKPSGIHILGISTYNYHFKKELKAQEREGRN